MDDEHEDDDGIDAARSGGRNEDSGDETRGVQVTDSGEIGRGTPDSGMEQGRPDTPRVNGTGEGVQQVAFQWRSAPLPTVDEFAGYERIQPGAANRIITMARNRSTRKSKHKEKRTKSQPMTIRRRTSAWSSPRPRTRFSHTPDSEALSPAPHSDNRWQPPSARSSEPSRPDHR